MAGIGGVYVVAVVVVEEFARAFRHAPCVVGQFREALARRFGVVPGIALQVFVDIQKTFVSAPAPVRELLDPFASGVHFPLDVFQLAVAFRVDHQVVPLQAGVVDDIVAVIDASAVGGMGVVDAHAQAVVGAGGLISLPVHAFHQTVRLVVDVLSAFLLPGFRDAVNQNKGEFLFKAVPPLHC